MAKPVYFFSYARNDSDKFMEKFHEDLAKEVRGKLGTSDDVGFLDTEDIKLGMEWPTTLTQALQDCQVFIPVYSPTYFNRDFCGKEWRVFRTRLSKANQNDKAKILPVLWRPVPDKALPKVAENLQYSHKDLGETYSNEGLLQLVRLRKHHDPYVEFLNKFADRVVAASKQPQTPPLPDPPSIKTIQADFPTKAADPVVPPGTASTGPKNVLFIFVVGKKADLEQIRTSGTQGYGSLPRDWKPFAPNPDIEIGLLAQRTAYDARLFSNIETFKPNQDFLDTVRKAQKNNTIVAIIVDPWTVRLQPIHQILQQYDQHNFMNALVFIPANPQDTETAEKMHELQNAIRTTFPARIEQGERVDFYFGKVDPKTFPSRLAGMLEAVRSRIISEGDLRREMNESGIFVMPRISGTNGGS